MTLRPFGLALLVPASLTPPLLAGAPPDPVAAYAPAVARLVEAARREGRAWLRLEQLTDTFGHRLAGSPQLEAALRWAADGMRADGLDAVRLEPVAVPHWERGQESLELLAPVRQELVMLGLGNSVGMPPEGLEAGLAIVRSFDELEARAADVRGRIVLFDVPYARDLVAPAEVVEDSATSGRCPPTTAEEAGVGLAGDVGHPVLLRTR